MTTKSTNTNTSNNNDNVTMTKKHTNTGSSTGGGGSNDDDSSSSNDNDSSVNSSSSNEGQQHAHDNSDSDESNDSSENNDNDEDTKIGGHDSNQNQIPISILKSLYKNQRKTLAFERKRYKNQIQKKPAIGSLPSLKKIVLVVALLLILTKDLKFTKTFKSMIKNKLVDRIFGQINDVVKGGQFFIKKARFVVLVKTEGVLPPTGGSFSGLGVFLYSPNMYQPTVAERW